MKCGKDWSFPREKPIEITAQCQLIFQKQLNYLVNCCSSVSSFEKLFAKKKTKRIKASFHKLFTYGNKLTKNKPQKEKQNSG